MGRGDTESNAPSVALTYVVPGQPINIPHSF